MIELLLAFIGYLIGRIGDYYAGHWDFFHHWIYGVIFCAIGYFLSNGYVFFFGLGLFISDIKDFYHFEVFGPDKKTVKKFWGFD